MHAPSIGSDASTGTRSSETGIGRDVLFFSLVAIVAVMLVITRWIAHSDVSGFTTTSFLLISAAVHLAALVMIIPSAIVLSVALYRFIRRRINVRRLTLLGAPFLLLAGASLIPFPGFSERVSRSIRTKVDEAALVDVANRSIIAPPDWAAKGVDAGDSSKIEAWIASEPALAALGFKRPSHILMEKSTLCLEWGSPVSPRWGIAISTKTNSLPTVRSGAVETARIYQSVFLYSVPD